MRGATGTTSPLGERGRSVPGLKACALATLALLLAGCASQRLGGGGGYASTPVYGGRQVAAVEPVEEPLQPAPPSSPITSSPLPPAPGTTLAPAAGPGGAPLEPVPAVPPVANLGAPAAPAPSAPAAPSATRVSATGKWTAKEASGGSCSVALSSAPALDLYKASTSGCANKDLQGVNAWEFRDGEVYLYARGGVVARLRDSGGSFSGALAKSGAPLTLTK